MMPSDAAHREAAARLARLNQLLDKDQLAAEIDAPIDAATQQFQLVREFASSHEEFCTVPGRFVQCLYERALPQHLKLTPSQAQDEAIRLLELGYGGTYSDCYDEAVLDARDPQQSGLRAVIDGIASLVKAEQHERRMRWAYGLCIESANWETRCAMASLVMEQSDTSHDAALQRVTPEQMADYIPDLLEGMTSDATAIEQVVRNLWERGLGMLGHILPLMRRQRIVPGPRPVFAKAV